MLSEADAKYVWKNSIFRSTTLSIIPWADTEKSGIWQIELSQEILTKYIDNYIKNIKVDNKSVVYNSNNELSVPFDNDSIYYDEINKVWKSNTSNIINPESIMKTLNTNDFIVTEGGNNKGKISVTNGYNDELAIDDPTSGGEFVNYMRTRQIGIKLIPTQNGKANASFNQKTGELEIWDPSFKNNDITANFEIIKTSTTTELKTTDDSLPTNKYINEHYQLKGSGGNDWELVDTSCFVSFSNKKYQIRNYDSTKYIYKIWIGINENNRLLA
ncbi:MAG: hypothetical protein OHM56_01355 [Spiroplasma phoeniceum]|nr:MAG: hypothetical protein OHM57_00780 [Spiroplasma phoeniceum]UZQ32638.1 MAG: hypothetical protein OHM56_01355 [Spiroplasma phoeniceum]